MSIKLSYMGSWNTRSPIDYENLNKTPSIEVRVMSRRKSGKIINLMGSEVDKLDNLGVAVQALVEAEIEACNKECYKINKKEE